MKKAFLLISLMCVFIFPEDAQISSIEMHSLYNFLEEHQSTRRSSCEENYTIQFLNDCSNIERTLKFRVAFNKISTYSISLS